MQQNENRYREDPNQLRIAGPAAPASYHCDMQKHYKNHMQGVQTHRIAAATTSMKQYTMEVPGAEIDQNGFLISKRNSVAGCNSTNLSANTTSGMKGGNYQQETHQMKQNQRLNPFVQTFNHNENVDISNFQQNMAANTSAISAQLSNQGIHLQQKQDLQNQDFIQKASTIQQNLINCADVNSSQTSSQQANQQVVTRQLHQSKTHRAQIGQVANNLSKNQSRHSNLQNYGYQQRIERIASSKEKENIQVQNCYLDEHVIIANQALQNNREPNLFQNQQMQQKRGSFVGKSSQIQNVQNLQFAPQMGNMQNNQSFPNQNQTKNQDNMIIENTLTFVNSRESRDPNILEQQPDRAVSQPRADSCGPAPGAASQGRSGGALNSSGGSIGSHSYKTASGLSGPGGLFRSKTQGKIGGSTIQAKSSILARIICPCYMPNDNHPKRTAILAYKGSKQPIIHNSDNTVNCSQCGQFYAVKDQSYTHISASGRKQFASQAQIVKTVREKGTIFKLDEPVSEIFKRMREMSNNVLKDLKPHPYYLTKRVKRIDDLSYIAECLQSDNQTIHHAVHLMDIYSSKMRRVRDYDTLLISLVCLLISTKYLQIKYPGADTLNDMVTRRYNADLIIAMEGRVLDIIDWQLMVFPIYDYVKLFISQGCLFENEDILKEAAPQQPQDDPSEENIRDTRVRGKPTVQLAEHFKKYAEFFADFCLYQECFMTQDPYLLACAIVAYTRKYMGVGIIWPHELELLAQCSFSAFRDLYSIIELKYTENFPDHAKSQNYPDQLLTEPVQGNTANGPVRKNGAQLQLSSGNKTQKTQGSSKKHGTSFNANTNNMMDLKTPDKCVFDFNSVVSGGKGYTQDKFSHEKFHINSNSIEKFRIKKTNQQVQKTIADISASQSKAPTGVIFSDNKKQSVNSHSFKKMIMKNQVSNNLSDDKKITAATNAASQNQATSHQIVAVNNYLPQYQRRAQVIKNNAQMHENYSSQKSQKSQPIGGAASNTMNHPQISISVINNNVTSPSANINENEQEVPPFKPMIIKSNSQAIGGGYECKTTTKKSPKGADLEKINTLKEAMNSVNITAKLPSSTTNQSSSTIKLKINSSFNNKMSFNQQKDGPQTNKSYGALGMGGSFGVGYGPIKINQKIKMNVGSNQKQKSSNNGNSTAKKSQKSQYTQETSSSQKMQPSKSYVNPKMGDINSMKQLNNQSSLNATYQQRLAEQRAKNAQQQQQQQLGANQYRRPSPGQQQVPQQQQQQQQQSLAQQRNVSCVSHNQTRPVPQDKQQSYISGKPKNPNLGAYIYSNNQAAPQQQQQAKQQANYGCTGSSSTNAGSQSRSVLSVKNAAQVIKRKNSYQNQTIEIRQSNVGKVNTTREVQINVSNVQPSQGQVIMEPAVMTQQANCGKNIPNALLRRATNGAQGRQTSIGALSHYKSSGSHQPAANARGSQESGAVDTTSRERGSLGIDSQGSAGKPGSLPKTSSLDELTPQSQKGAGNANHTVNPPAIIFNTGALAKNKSFSNAIDMCNSNTTSSLNATKATLVKMIQEKGINPGSQASQYMSEQPGIVAQQQNRHTSHLHPQIMTTSNTRQNTMRQFNEENHQQQSLSLERAQAMAAAQGQTITTQLLDGKPIQKMIKSGSQVLGKCRSRLNISRKEMLKQLNDKKDKMSQLVEAAQHATRCTSNEKTTSTKKQSHSEAINNFNTSQFEIHQLFQAKHHNQNAHHQRINFQTGCRAGDFEHVSGINGSFSGERPSMTKNQNATAVVSQFMASATNDENSNSINIQNMRPHASMDQNQSKPVNRPSAAYNGQNQQQQNTRQNA